MGIMQCYCIPSSLLYLLLHDLLVSKVKNIKEKLFIKLCENMQHCLNTFSR